MLTKIINVVKRYFIPFLIFTIVRVFGYILMIYNPLWGLVVSFILDFFDSTILYYYRVPISYYHSIDKPVDYLQYIFILFLSWNTSVFIFILCAFIFRSIGSILYMFTKKRVFFVLTPNFIEYIYLFYIIGILYNYPNLAFDSRVWIGLIVFKLIQEICTHGLELGNAYVLPKLLHVPQRNRS